MSTAAFPDRVREYFTLEQTEREARALPDTSRSTTTRAMALAFQKREAAETLWPRGSTAEALALARAALDGAGAALASFAESTEAKPTWLGRARTIVDDARARTADAKLPELEAHARPGDEETFRVMTTALLELEQTMGLGLAAPQDIASTRRARVATAIATTLVVLAALVWWFHTPLVLQATASSQLPGAYGADKAIDDDPKTAWLLPDKQTGWLDVTFGKARSVKALRIASGNPPWNDRSAKDAHVEAFLGGQVVKAADVTFQEPEGADPSWSEVPLGVKCDRVRIDVRSFHKASGGIAEVQLK